MKSIVRIFLLVLTGFVLTGCSLSYDLNPPITSSAEFEQGGKSQILVFVKDARSDKQFIKGITGLEGVSMSISNVKNPVEWLSESLQQEFLSHGITITFSNDPAKESAADTILTVDSYTIINSRKSGFHPFVTFHSFSGKIQTSDTDSQVISYFVYGKTPIWSMDEVQEPCFDMPSAILIKGIAAKINRFALHYRMSDGELDALNKTAQAKVDGTMPNAYLSVLEIGQSNNPHAIAYLKPFTQNGDTLIRACALSAFGMIGDPDTFDFLKEQYAKRTDIDRFMAIKSIGDLGTAEAIQFLKDARKDPQYNGERGYKFAVNLYLEAAGEQ